MAFVAQRDFFLAHASEDKPVVARPLANELTGRGYSVWFDEFELRVGQSLREEIDRGLRDSSYGIVVLSPSFFSKRWPQQELNGLAARETALNKNVILPVWHDVQQPDVAGFSPILADRVGVPTGHGIPAVVDAIVRAVRLVPRRKGFGPLLHRFDRCPNCNSDFLEIAAPDSPGGSFHWRCLDCNRQGNYHFPLD